MIKCQLKNPSQMGVKKAKNGGYACPGSMQMFLCKKNVSNTHTKFIARVYIFPKLRNIFSSQI